MLLNRMVILEEVTRSSKNINDSFFKRQDLLKESAIEEKEARLQQLVSYMFTDRQYYKPFQEAALPVSPAPTLAAPNPNVAKKEELLKNQLDSISNQEKNIVNKTPAVQQNLDNKKLEIQAALEKLKIDSHERIAQAQLAQDKKIGTKRAVASAIAQGAGMALPGTLIGGLTQLNWGKIGTGIAGAAKSVVGLK